MRDGNVTTDVRNSDPSNRMYADGQVDDFINWIWDSNNEAISSRFPSKCMPNALPGPVSHFMFNSYQIGDPTWDAATSTLSVNVGSPHFRTDGSLASGYYEMYFPTAVAKCMWGVTDTGATKANVSVTNADGTPNVATISQTSDQNGLTVIASNFHFSSPTIREKLTQEAVGGMPSLSSTSSAGATGVSAAQTPLPVARPVVAAPPKVISKKIVCLKGKVKKEVVGSQCPKGFRKSG